MVYPHQPAPLYQQVANKIRQKIQNGTWAHGDRIPSERQLEQIFEVSRITIRHAIRLAVQEGMLVQHHGAGTYVIHPDQVEQDLSEVRTFAQTLTDIGHVASTTIISQGSQSNTLVLANLLKLDPIHRVFNLRLVGHSDAKPVVVYDSYFSLELGQRIAQLASDLELAGKPFTTLDLYANETINTKPIDMKQSIEASPAPDEMKTILAIKSDEDIPLLIIESIINDNHGPIEFRRAYYRSDWYKFMIHRHL